MDRAEYVAATQKIRRFQEIDKELDGIQDLRKHLNDDPVSIEIFASSSNDILTVQPRNKERMVIARAHLPTNVRVGVEDFIRKLVSNYAANLEAERQAL